MLRLIEDKVLKRIFRSNGEKVPVTGYRRKLQGKLQKLCSSPIQNYLGD
jgi:hypothetical protein